jgi:anaerobic magnesium-protoporphyrin IX monomethyl ester cyclase
MDYYCLLRMPHATARDRVFPMYASRGCPYRCNFCYCIDTGVRLRSPGSIVAEIRELQQRYGVTYIAFMDDLLMYSAHRMRQLCAALIDAELNIKWSGNGRLNIVTPELLGLMKQAGCVLINYGIECLDDEILARMHKQLTVEQITAGIEATLTAGISPGYNIIFGNLGETRATLQRGVEFLLRYDDQGQRRTIRPVTPYPGSELYQIAIREGKLAGPEDFYEHKHVNSDLLSVNFTELSDEEFHAALFEANKTLLENYYAKLAERAVDSARQLYFERDASFRGFRHT